MQLVLEIGLDQTRAILYIYEVVFCMSAMG